MKRPVYYYSDYKLALLFSGEISCGRLLPKAAIVVDSFSLIVPVSERTLILFMKDVWLNSACPSVIAASEDCLVFF